MTRALLALRALAMFGAAATIATGCSRERAHAPAANAPPPAAPAPATAAFDLPTAALDRMDSRTPLPLFHRVADGIASAARAHDRGRVVTELGNTLAACTSCHATWKQQVVDAPTWERLAGAAAPTHATP